MQQYSITPAHVQEQRDDLIAKIEAKKIEVDNLFTTEFKDSEFLKTQLDKIKEEWELFQVQAIKRGSLTKTYDINLTLDNINSFKKLMGSIFKGKNELIAIQPLLKKLEQLQCLNDVNQYLNAKKETLLKEQYDTIIDTVNFMTIDNNSTYHNLKQYSQYIETQQKKLDNIFKGIKTELKSESNKQAKRFDKTWNLNHHMIRFDYLSSADPAINRDEWINSLPFSFEEKQELRKLSCDDFSLRNKLKNILADQCIRNTNEFLAGSKLIAFIDKNRDLFSLPETKPSLDRLKELIKERKSIEQTAVKLVKSETSVILDDLSNSKKQEYKDILKDRYLFTEDDFLTYSLDDLCKDLYLHTNADHPYKDDNLYNVKVLARTMLLLKNISIETSRFDPATNSTLAALLQPFYTVTGAVRDKLIVCNDDTTQSNAQELIERILDNIKTKNKEKNELEQLKKLIDKLPNNRYKPLYDNIYNSLEKAHTLSVADQPCQVSNIQNSKDISSITFTTTRPEVKSVSANGLVGEIDFTTVTSLNAVSSIQSKSLRYEALCFYYKDLKEEDYSKYWSIRSKLKKDFPISVSEKHDFMDKLRRLNEINAVSFIQDINKSEFCLLFQQYEIFQYTNKHLPLYLRNIKKVQNIFMIFFNVTKQKFVIKVV